jgi:hypothetical protein
MWADTQRRTFVLAPGSPAPYRGLWRIEKMSLLSPFLGKTRRFQTNLTGAEIQRRLSATLTKRWFRHAPGARWRGWADDGQFRLTRLTGHRNSFQAEFLGRIVPSEEGPTTVEVRACMNVWVVLFCLLWCSGVGAAGVAVLTEGDLHTAAAPAFMLLFMFALCQFGFHSDAGTGWRTLQNALEAEPL